MAAHLARGTPLTAFGPPRENLVTLPPPRLSVSAAEIVGEVLHIDRFGNLISSIGRLSWEDDERLQFSPRFGAQINFPGALVAAACRVQIGNQPVGPIRRTYGAVPAGEVTALIGSAGQLEIGVNQGNAAQALQATIGDPVMLRFA